MASQSPLKTLLFYNHFGNGDVHCSRELVKFFVAKQPAEKYLYAQKNSERLLMDISVEQVPLSNWLPTHQPFRWDPKGGTLALNTWYGVSDSFTKHGCTLNTLYDLFGFHIERHSMKFKLSGIENFLPRVYWRKYAIDGINKRVAAPDWWSYSKRVMICNGMPLSGQSRLEGKVLSAVVTELAARRPDVLFLLTNEDTLPLPSSPPTRYLIAPNVVYTRDIIGLPRGTNDLCENGYLSTFCDVIVGRGSGSYTYAYLADNFLDADKKMVCFTAEESTARWIYPTHLAKATIIWSNRTAQAEVGEVLRKALL